MTGPPDIIPDVARTMHGSGEWQISSLMFAVSTLLKMGDRNGFSFCWKICVLRELLRYSGYAVWIAVASQIIPSRYTGHLGIFPRRICSSITSMTSCDLPTAKTGISTFPPLDVACCRKLPISSDASALVGVTSLCPP